MTAVVGSVGSVSCVPTVDSPAGSVAEVSGVVPVSAVEPGVVAGREVGGVVAGGLVEGARPHGDRAARDASQ